MGNTKFIWVVVYDGEKPQEFEGTFDEIVLKMNPGDGQPIAIIRKEMLD